MLQGRLSRDFYVGEREVFPAGSPVKLTVGKLERRRRGPNDHWPGVIKLYAGPPKRGLGRLRRYRKGRSSWARTKITTT